MRTQRPLTLMTVRSKEWLNPAMLRIIFHAPGLAPTEFTDAYVKLLFNDNGPITENPGERPPTRTYTLRAFDPETEEATLDFVIHGDEGRAAPWAAKCNPGDQVLARGPGGRWAPSPDVDFHLFIGDESSVPAIAGALERLDEQAKGLVIVETHEHDLTLPTPADVEVRWLIAERPYRPSRLAEAVGELDWHAFGDVEVFAHGEREAIKALRPVLSAHVADRSRLSISGYWAYGRAEDQFQAEKKTDIGKI